jgi:hypothetical protein
MGSEKDCYCKTCKKYFHHLGIARHRAAHRDKYQDCIIYYTHTVGSHEYSKLNPKKVNHETDYDMLKS